MLRFIRYEWAMFMANFTETNRVILTRSIWVIATSELSALFFGLQQGSLRDRVIVALISGVGMAITLYVVV